MLRHWVRYDELIDAVAADIPGAQDAGLYDWQGERLDGNRTVADHELRSGQTLLVGGLQKLRKGQLL